MRRGLLLLASLSCSSFLQARGPATVEKDLVYATVAERELKLDLYLPAATSKPPLVVWIHGGAWRRGSKDNPPVLYLVDAGFALASVDYRLSPEAKFPALVHDCKAAIRWLRAKAKKYGYDASRVGIAGSSAGGHLVALIGTTNGHQKLEGEVGEHRDASSDVHAVVNLYGPTNFLTILKQSTPHGLSVRVPALKLLLGDLPENKADLAKLASPVFHVDDAAPPLLMLHGDQDPQVPINQSHELHAAYKEVGRPVHFHVVHGGHHGGPLFHDEARRELVVGFLRRRLRPND